MIHRVDEGVDEKLGLEERQLEPVGVRRHILVVGLVEDVVVDDRVVDFAGKCVLGVAVGGELGVHPLVDLVEDLLDAVGHEASEHLIRGTWKPSRNGALKLLPHQLSRIIREHNIGWGLRGTSSIRASQQVVPGAILGKIILLFLEKLLQRFIDAVGKREVDRSLIMSITPV